MFPQTLTSAVWQTVGAIITIIAFAVSAIAIIQKSQLTTKRKMLLNVITVFLTLLLIVGTGWVSYVLSPPGQRPSPTPGTANTAGNKTPSQLQSPTVATEPSATAPSGLVPNGLIQKNITLTCGCSDPIRVTINTIQIDGANGRMIWNTTLKDIAGSDLYFGINEYSLQSSTSQTPFLAAFPSTSYLTNNIPYDMKMIFTFIPSYNITYTLTVVMTANGLPGGGETISFNPINISF
jgi:hypothetical protein